MNSENDADEPPRLDRSLDDVISVAVVAEVRAAVPMDRALRRRMAAPLIQNADAVVRLVQEDGRMIAMGPVRIMTAHEGRDGRAPLDERRIALDLHTLPPKGRRRRAGPCLDQGNALAVANRAVSVMSDEVFDIVSNVGHGT